MATRLVVLTARQGAGMPRCASTLQIAKTQVKSIVGRAAMRRLVKALLD
jgi:hypothetical protein